jgi:hypothetical protein
MLDIGCSMFDAGVASAILSEANQTSNIEHLTSIRHPLWPSLPPSATLPAPLAES